MQSAVTAVRDVLTDNIKQLLHFAFALASVLLFVSLTARYLVLCL